EQAGAEAVDRAGIVERERAGGEDAARGAFDRARIGDIGAAAADRGGNAARDIVVGAVERAGGDRAAVADRQQAGAAIVDGGDAGADDLAAGGVGDAGDAAVDQDAGAFASRAIDAAGAVVGDGGAAVDLHAGEAVAADQAVVAGEDAVVGATGEGAGIL